MILTHKDKVNGTISKIVVPYIVHVGKITDESVLKNVANEILDKDLIFLPKAIGGIKSIKIGHITTILGIIFVLGILIKFKNSAFRKRRQR